MEDTLVIIISTLGFVLVLLNNIVTMLVGMSIGVLSILFILLRSNKINLVTKVSTLIVSSITLILGVLWLIRSFL